MPDDCGPLHRFRAGYEGPSPASPDNKAGIWPTPPTNTPANRRTASPLHRSAKAKELRVHLHVFWPLPCGEHIHPSWRAEWQVFGAQAFRRGAALPHGFSVNRSTVNRKAQVSKPTRGAKFIHYEVLLLSGLRRATPRPTKCPIPARMPLSPRAHHRSHSPRTAHLVVERSTFSPSQLRAALWVDCHCAGFEPR